VLSAEQLDTPALRRQLRWCLSEQGRQAAAAAKVQAASAGDAQLQQLIGALEG